MVRSAFRRVSNHESPDVSGLHPSKRSLRGLLRMRGEGVRLGRMRAKSYALHIFSRL
jgi:hypothetical protein